MAKIIKSEDLGNYYIEIRTAGAAFRVILAETYDNGGHYQTLRETTSANEASAKKVFNRYKAYARNIAINA